jgi:transcriptional regulator with XRE-family HTH domain
MMVVRRERDREVNGRFARLVSKARKKAGPTQADLAVMVGMTGVVSNWEQGVFLPPADKREKIAHVLGLNSKAVERAASNRGPSQCAKARRPAFGPRDEQTDRAPQTSSRRLYSSEQVRHFPATTLDLPHSAASPWCAMVLQHWWGAMIDSGLGVNVTPTVPLAEHVIRNDGVGGSIPSRGTIKIKGLAYIG